MADNSKKELEESEIKEWKKDKNRIVKFFSKFDLNVADIYDHIIILDGDKTRATCYLLSKVMMVMKICDFLDILEKREQADVDIIKIYLLISHAEITMNSFGIKGNKDEKIEKFFDPVIDKYNLNNKIRMDRESIEKTEAMSSPKMLWKIRCEYTHEGNYTGKIFKTTDDDSPSWFKFKSNDKEVCGGCNLTYQKFLNIFMDALIENIKIFSGYEG